MAEDDEISIDLSKIKNFFRRSGKEKKTEIKEEKAELKKEEKKVSEEHHTIKKEKKEIEKEENIAEKEIKIEKKIDSLEKKKAQLYEDEFSVDWKKAYDTVKRYNILLLLLIPLIFSIYLRVQPWYLPVTDNWASSTVQNYYRSQIESQINQQYPNLPAQNKEVLITGELNKILESQQVVIEQQTQQLSEQYKERLRDKDGNTYLLAIDPYFWYRYARNIESHGYHGDEIKDGIQWDNHMMAPAGRPTGGDMLNAYLMFYLHSFISILKPDMTLFGSVFFLPVILASLCVIPAFFLARKFAGDYGGFIAGMIIAVHSAFLTRTAGGFSDTDAYAVLFPLYIAWIFFEGFGSSSLKKKVMMGISSGILAGIFSIAWGGGWWYIMYFLLGTTGLYFLYLTYINISELKKGLTAFLKIEKVRNTIILSVLFFISTGIIVTLYYGWYSFYSGLTGPLFFATMKVVGVTSVWPNVFTTVAEQGGMSFQAVIANMGGYLMFSIAALGIILTIVKKDSEGKHDIKFAIFLTLWFIATVYAATKGVRYLLMIVPAFSIAFGVALGVAYEKISRWLSSELNIKYALVAPVMMILLSLLILNPVRAGYSTAVNEVPSMNDAWFNSLDLINQNATKDAIITSWWDFGHWFKAITDRAVTFDGTSQNKPQAHWVGKTLLTADEDMAAGILRMLHCSAYESGTKAFDEIDSHINYIPKSIDILNEVMVSGKEKASDILKQYNIPEENISKIIGYTYCTPPENYFIASEDMIGKAGVWAHFGSWDFNKAAMYNKVHSLDSAEGIALLKSDFNKSDEDAERLYYEIQNTDANQWISPWPGYATGKMSCPIKDNIAVCPNGVEVSLPDFKATIPTQQGKKLLQKVTWADSSGVNTKTFTGDIVNLGIALTRSASGFDAVMADPMLSDSMFTRLFYMNGHGLKHFKHYSYQSSVFGHSIYVYKLDWESDEIYIDPIYTQPVEVKASHILIQHQGSQMSSSNRTEEQAKEMAEQIKEKLEKGDDFDTLAKEFSDDPSAQLSSDLGYFSRGMMVSEFENAAFNMKPGEISEPVKTAFGYHIIKVTEIKTFDDLLKNETG